MSDMMSDITNQFEKERKERERQDKALAKSLSISAAVDSYNSAKSRKDDFSIHRAEEELLRLHSPSISDKYYALMLDKGHARAIGDKAAESSIKYEAERLLTNFTKNGV